MSNPDTSTMRTTDGNVRFHLAASATRVEQTRDTLATLAERSRAIAEASTRQEIAAEKDHERLQAEAEEQLAQRREAITTRHNDEIASIARLNKRWESTLEQLDRQARRDYGSSDAPEPAPPRHDASKKFQAATARFTEYTRMLGIVRDEAKLTCMALRPFKREFDIGAVDPVSPPVGDELEALVGLRKQLVSQRGELAAQRSIFVRLRHHPLLVTLAVGSILTAGGVTAFLLFNAGLDRPIIGIASLGFVIAAIAVLITLRRINNRWHALLDELADEVKQVVGSHHWHLTVGKRRLDPAVTLADEMDGILSAERAREEAAKRAAERAQSAREQRLARVSALRSRHTARIERLTKANEAHHQQAKAALSAEEQALQEQVAAKIRDAAAQRQAARADQAAAITADLQTALRSLDADLSRTTNELRADQREWREDSWREWQESRAFPLAVPLATLHGEASDLLGDHRFGAGITIPNEPAEFTLSADLVLPEAGRLLISGDDGLSVMHQAMLRLMLGSPFGKVRFTIVDPVGLGNGFAPFLRLRDADEHIVGPKVWTSPVEVERALANLSEHAEKVIQKYLRDRFATLADYNETAGDLAEPYQVLVIADFPQGFSDTALERLDTLVKHGPRCGIFVWLQHGSNTKLPDIISRNVFLANGVVLQQGPGGWRVPLPPLQGWRCELEELPDTALRDRLLDDIGERTAACSELALPIEAGLPDEANRWTRDSGEVLRIPMGRHGADSIHEMELGRGTAQHVLIGGRTGSGKSTLLHALITAGAFWYSPDQLEFHLIDFKKGVEFKVYGSVSLPHARVVAVESDREFGLSVLRSLDQELDRRGQLFRAAGVQDLASFRKASPNEIMPRSLLIIDEFQELFVEDDAIAHDAAMLLDRFVRQGRAFGMHVVLGSQSLGGSSALARSTIGQIGVRIALQCSEADSQLLLNDDNTAARLLERPGEAIYNDRSGMREGNTPFQVFWINDDQQRELLAGLPHDDARETVIFEGSAAAQIGANRALAQLLSAPTDVSAPPRIWLGEPNALGGPCAIDFGPGATGNVVTVGHHREAAYGMGLASIVSLAAAKAPDELRFIIIDGDPADDRAHQRLRELIDQLPHEIRTVAPGEAGTAISELAGTVDSHTGTTVLMVFGLHRLSDLRVGDAFDFSSERSAGDDFADILGEGPAHGIFTWIWCDSMSSLSRCFNRTAQRAFGHRIAFQMSAGDSSDLLDDGAAAHLGLHNALAVDINSGTRVKLRPYVIPEGDELARLLAGIRSRWQR